MNTKPECYILSAYRAGAPFVENHQAHKRLGSELRRYGAIKELSGAYKGVPEECWLIIVDPEDKEPHETIRDLLREHGQECALYLDANRMAYYLYAHYADGIKPIGPFVEVSREFLSNYDAYTLDNGRYYAARSFE